MKGSLGLRIDVDTFRGTRIGVPSLCTILGKHGIKCTFFFSVGPDNMGRHLWRLLRPEFFLKMLRTRAANTYGWDILLRGTFGNGPIIGAKLPAVLRAASAAGHEIGLHAWDHHHWQSRVERFDVAAARADLLRGINMLTRAAGVPPSCSAAPGWRCTDPVLSGKAFFPGLRYNSDCRGTGVFRPLVSGRAMSQPQVPVNLPTWDEVVGREGLAAEDYNDFLLSLLNPGGYNALATHAEVEGISEASSFEDLIVRVLDSGYRIVPLGTLVSEAGETLPQAPLVRSRLPGREGWISTRG